MSKKQFVQILFAFFMQATFLAGCSQIASGGDTSDDDEYVYTPNYVDPGW